VGLTGTDELSGVGVSVPGGAACCWESQGHMGGPAPSVTWPWAHKSAFITVLVLFMLMFFSC
jgi:hypothetical protein